MQTLTLDNGLTLEFADATRRYYGNFYRVRIVASCAVPLTTDACGSLEDYERLRKTYGDRVPYERALEKMGVPGEELDAVREHLVARFLETARPYLEDPAFPCRYLAKLTAEMKKRPRRR